MHNTTSAKTHWGIGAKLGLAFTSVLSLIAVILAVSLLRLADLSASMQQVIEVEWKKADAATALDVLFAANTRRTMQELISDEAGRKALRDEVLQARGHYVDAFKFLQSSVQTAAGIQALEQLEAKRQTYVQSQQRFYALLDAGEVEQATSELQVRTLPILSEIQKQAQALAAMGQQNAAAYGHEAVEQARHARWTVAALGAIAFVLGGLLAWRMTRAITVPIGEAVRVAQSVAQGNLDNQIVVTTRDETGQLLRALQHMNGNLRTIVDDVRAGSVAIASATTQIATGNMSRSSRTEEQARAREETTAAMQEMANTVQQNHVSSQQAARFVATASEVAMRGGQEVGDAVSTMRTVNASSRKIADIIGIIDSIAFQTNILALNAAVEAARAGDQGRGFAVVAGEVRTLARRSADAAKEIKTLIDESVTSVNEGCALVERAGTTMDEIVRSVRKVADIMGEINGASESQSHGIAQINQAMIQMDQVTQSNAALVEESAAAAQSLEAQAQALVRAISVFRSGTDLPDGVLRAPQRVSNSAPPQRLAVSARQLAAAI